MVDPALEASRLMDLRLRAASRLESNDAAKASTARATHSLAVLHALASAPATAADALAVLHELQVHHVEVDLQAEELRDSRAELETALRRQMQLFDFMPVACFAMDRSLVVCALNRMGTRMLGVDQDAAHGLVLNAFFAADSLVALHQLLAQVGMAGHASSNLQWRGRQGSPQWVRAEAGRDPSGQGYFLVLIALEVPPQHGTAPRPG